jgi:hypothetical protein
MHARGDGDGDGDGDGTGGRLSLCADCSVPERPKGDGASRATK